MNKRLKNSLFKCIVPSVMGYEREKVLYCYALDCFLIFCVKYYLTSKIVLGEACSAESKLHLHITFSEFTEGHHRFSMCHMFVFSHSNLNLTIGNYSVNFRLKWSDNYNVSQNKSLCLSHVCG